MQQEPEKKRKESAGKTSKMEVRGRFCANGEVNFAHLSLFNLFTFYIQFFSFLILLLETGHDF